MGASYQIGFPAELSDRGSGKTCRGGIPRFTGSPSKSVSGGANPVNLSNHHTGPAYLEKTIKDICGIHIPDNRISRELLFHTPVEIIMKNRHQGNLFGRGGLDPCRCGRMTYKSSTLMDRRDGLSHSWMMHPILSTRTLFSILHLPILPSRFWIGLP